MSGGGGSSQPQQATLSSAQTASSPSDTPSVATQESEPSAEPSGPCSPESIQVTPTVTGGIAGGAIKVDLALTTSEAACTFAMSGKSLAVKVMSGATSVWSSQDCASVVPTGSLTLRHGSVADASLTWDGHQSNGNCGATNPWVGPGTYQVLASVIGSTPTSSDFSLSLPTAKTITKTAQPKVKNTKKADKQPKQGSKKSLSGKGTACGGDNAVC